MPVKRPYVILKRSASFVVHLGVVLLLLAPGQLVSGGSWWSETSFEGGTHINTTVDNGLVLERSPGCMTWRMVSDAPSARSFCPIAYSEDADVALLFGGQSKWDGALSDTWVYEDRTWKVLDVTTSPSARYGHSMVYIDSTKEFMMSGGVDDAHSHTADWWAFDTTNRSWHELDPQDPPWGGPFIPMVYDPDDDVVIMFGGHFEDTLWIYDVQDLLWEVRIPDNSPSQRTNHSAAYIGNGLMMVHGGETLEGTALNDTWMYNYTSDVWTEAVTTNAPIASGNGMAYIPERNEVLMFGAEPWPHEGGTWVFYVSTSNWSSPYLTPEPALRAYYGIAYLSVWGRVLMCGGGLQKHYEPPGDYSEPNRWNTWEFDAPTSTWHQVMPEGYHRVVYADNDTYLIGLEIWQLRSDRYWERVHADTGNLSDRTGHAAAYMEHRREIVLFGGMPGPGPVASPDRLNDIWVFDASESRWIEVAVSPWLA